MSAKTPQENLFDLYFKYVEESESPTIFHRWSLIASVSALLGRSCWLPHGTNRFFPNMYVMLIGDPGTRKSSAIKGARKLLSHSGYETFAAEKTTKEKFLLDLEGLPETYGESNYVAKSGRRADTSKMLTPEDVLRNLDLTTDHDGTPREVFICADEFNEFAGSGNLDFLSLLGSLWDWDDELAPYKHRLKNSKSLAIYQPTISLLGGNTHAGFKSAFPIESIGQGFMSRLLLVYGESSGRKIAFPSRPPEELGTRICEYLKTIKTTVKGEVTLTVEARRSLVMIYGAWQPLEDYRYKHYSTRRFTHLLKLLMVVAAMRLSTEINQQDVVMANTILTYTESFMSKAMGEFGKSRNSEATQTIMTTLYEAKKPLSFEDLWKVVNRDLEKRDALSEILQSLLQAGKIQPPDPKAGKHAGFMALQKPLVTKALYVDYRILQETKGKV